MDLQGFHRWYKGAAPQLCTRFRIVFKPVLRAGGFESPLCILAQWTVRRILL